MFGLMPLLAQSTIPVRKQRKIFRAQQRNMVKNAGLEIDKQSNKYNRPAFPKVSQEKHIPGSEEKPAFPDLILYYGCARFNRTYNFLKLSFDQSNYPLEFKVEKREGSFFTTLKSDSLVVSEGKGDTLKVSKQCAVINAMKRLQSTNYAIEVKQNYFNPRRFPEFLEHVDPSLSHIYKVVCLRKPHDMNFPHALSGAVDYVSDENELSSYIQRHCTSTSIADLYVFNISKAQRGWVRDVGSKSNGWTNRPVLNCSDRGSCLQAPPNIRRIFSELRECGGETIKHKLIPPGSENIKPCEEDQKDDNPNSNDQHGGEHTVRNSLSNEANTNTIDPWISKHLIIVEFMTEENKLESAKELIFQAVRQCPMLEEFIVEKTRDKYSNTLLAEAMIDRMVIGRASGMKKLGVKHEACRDALENLRKHCRYIKAKDTYFGHETGKLPEFLTGPVMQTNLYRIVCPNTIRSIGQCESLFKNFRNQGIEDIFFSNSFPSHEREAIIDLARRMNLPVRLLDNKWFCVSKRINPKEIYTALLKCGKENKKYKLIIPDRFDSEKKELAQKPFFNNLFDIKSESGVSCNEEPDSRRDHFQRSLSHEATSTYPKSNIVDPVDDIEENRANRRANLSKMFDITGNIEQVSSKSLPSNNNLFGGIEEHNLLKKERIIISTNSKQSYTPEKSGNFVQNASTAPNISSLTQSRMSSEGMYAESTPLFSEQKAKPCPQSHLETRIESIYNLGDDVWLDDFESPSQIPTHDMSSRPEKTPSLNTPPEIHHKPIAKEYNRTVQSQNLSFLPRHKIDEHRVRLDASHGIEENKNTYDQQRYEFPNKVANSCDIDTQFKQTNVQSHNFNQRAVYQSPWSQEKSNKNINPQEIKQKDYYHGNPSVNPGYEPEKNLTNDDHATLIGLERPMETNNSYGRQSNTMFINHRKNQIHSSDYHNTEEPPTKISRLFDIDPKTRQLTSESYNSCSQQFTDQSQISQRSAGFINKNSQWNDCDSIHFEKSQYYGRSESESRTETEGMTKIPDTRFVTKDTNDFTSQSKRVFNYQHEEFKPAKIFDYSERNTRIINNQNNRIPDEEHLYGGSYEQRLSEFRSNDRSSYGINRPESRTSNLHHSIEPSSISTAERTEQEPLHSGYSQHSSSWNRWDERNSYTNQRLDTQVSKLFDLIKPSRESTSQQSGRFSREFSNSFPNREREDKEYHDSFDRNNRFGGESRYNYDKTASTYDRSSGFRSNVGELSNQNELETGKLWKDNIKRLFDQR